MEYFWWLYLATRLDGVKEFFGWMTAIGGIGIIFTIIAWCIMVADEPTSQLESRHLVWKKWVAPWRNFALVLFFVCGFIYAITPTKKDAMFIAGGIGVIEGAKALHGSEIAKKSVSVVEAWLDKELSELVSSTKKGEKK